MKHLKIIFLLSVFFSPFGNIYFAYAQSETVKTALELSKKNKLRYVKTGKKAKIWYEGQKYKVRIDSISPERIFTKEKTFEINKIDKIAIRFKATMITGGVIGSVGLVFTVLGTGAIISGLLNDSLGGVFAGLIIDIMSVPVAAIGTSIFFIGKKYKKNKGWQFKAVQIE